MRTILCLLATAAVLVLAGPAEAALHATSAQWWWTPAACKSELKRFGVEIGDGRTFGVEHVYCVGAGGRHCQWADSHTFRRYKRFAVFARSYDGNVRFLWLNVTGRNDWSGDRGSLQLYGRMSARQFESRVGALTYELARDAHKLGCTG